MTNLSTEENTLINRAFYCADQNDIAGLLLCCDEGFDINTSRMSVLSVPAQMRGGVMGFEETVPSRAIRYSFKHNEWSLLASLIERFGAENLMMAEKITPDPAERLKGDAIQPFNSHWPDLSEKTFEIAPNYFCLWHICRPNAKIKSLPSSGSALFFVDLSPQKEKREADLKKFFQNCEALEQKNVLSAIVNDTKASKPVKTKSSL